MYVTYLKDSIGNNYLGVNITKDLVQPYLDNLKEIEDNYDEFVKNQQFRDNDKYHITVINVAELNRTSKYIGVDKLVNMIAPILKVEIDLNMVGIGTAEKNGNRTYYIVCESELLNEIRSIFNLPEFDFHITLGFDRKDVFGVRKNEVIKTDILK